MRITFRPMKADTYEPRKLVLPCWGQPKLDGLRATYIYPHFYSGDGKQWNDNVVAHILEPLVRAKVRHQLDGEFYRHGWKLQTINSHIGVNRILPKSDTGQVVFKVFDAVEYNAPFSDRLDIVLVSVDVLQCPSVQRVATRHIITQEDADDFYRSCLEKGYEGCIYRMSKSYTGKFVDQGYLNGRAHWMLKRKEIYDAEFKIVGAIEGRMTDKGGKYVGKLGALVCVTKEGREFQVGSGFSDSERDRLWKKKPIGQLLRVKYRMLSKDNKPIEPRSMGIRDYA